MNIFFCDIRGTIDGCSGPNRHLELVRFANNLRTLARVDNLEELQFSFVSGEDITSVQSFIAELKPYLAGAHIKVGHQFADKHILVGDTIIASPIVGKSPKVQEHLQEVPHGHIYFADDSAMEHLIFANIITFQCPQLVVTNFILGQSREEENIHGREGKGLITLNLILESYLQNQLLSPKKKTKKI